MTVIHWVLLTLMFTGIAGLILGGIFLLLREVTRPPNSPNFSELFVIAGVSLIVVGILFSTVWMNDIHHVVLDQRATQKERP